MASTIALILLAAFVLCMVITHKLRYLCATSTSTPTTPMATSPNTHAARMQIKAKCAGKAQLAPHLAVTPENLSRMCPSDRHGMCATPRSDYAISITDSTIDVDCQVPTNDTPVATRTTRVISYIRFSGYTRSDVSVSDRSTNYSFWSTLSSTKDSECGEVSEAHGCCSGMDLKVARTVQENVAIDTVEIGELDGFQQRNLLSFKPQKSRTLTTKNVKKHGYSQGFHPPAHSFTV